jgi:hypothetical protein
MLLLTHRKELLTACISFPSRLEIDAVVAAKQDMADNFLEGIQGDHHVN